MTASAQAQDAIGTVFANHQLAVDVAKNYIDWQDGVAAAESGRTAAEGFAAIARDNLGAARDSYEAVVAAASAGRYEDAYAESLLTAGFATGAECCCGCCTGSRRCECRCGAGGAVRATR